MVDFGKNLRGYVQGIIAAADFKINTSVLEGVNNKIKQIKRRAYGFRDDLYFFLKVKAAFHGLVATNVATAAGGLAVAHDKADASKAANQTNATANVDKVNLYHHRRGKHSLHS